MSVISGGGEDSIEPKETRTIPAFPELERNRCRSSDKDAGGLGSNGPTNTVSEERVKKILIGFVCEAEDKINRMHVTGRQTTV